MGSRTDGRVPNVLITGTPGTGKTSLASLVAGQSGFQHIEVGKWVKERGLHDGWDSELQCFVLDEDKVCDAMEESMSRGGNVVDYHGCDFFPERWFDLVVVLQTDNGILYDRLQRRGYTGRKLQENIECEIMHVIIEEARVSYREDILRVLKSNAVEDQEANLELVLAALSGRGLPPAREANGAANGSANGAAPRVRHGKRIKTHS